MRSFYLLFLFASIGVLGQENSQLRSSNNGGNLLAAKPIIDDAAIQNWEVLSNDKPITSADGKYFAFKVNRRNQPQIVILQSLQDSWKINFGNINLIGFSKNNRYLIYKNNDSLHLFDLIDRKTSRLITGLKNCQLPILNRPTSWLQSEDHEYEWLGWQLKNDDKLYIFNLITGIEKHYIFVSNYLFNQQGTALILHKIDNTIEWIDLSTNRSFIAWRPSDTKKQRPGAMTIDPMGKRLAFIVQDLSDKKTNLLKPLNSIWLYERDMNRVEEKANNQSQGIAEGLFITNSVSFNIDGLYLVFTLEPTTETQPPRNDIKVDIWNYKDTFLQSVQLYDKFENKFERNTYTASVNIKNNQIVQLHRLPGDRIKSLPVRDYVVVSSNKFNGNRFWQDQADSNWLISCKDGSRKLLHVNSNMQYYASYNNKYLLFYDGNIHHYFSFDLASGKINNLTAQLPPLIMAAERDDYFYGFEQPGKRLIGNWTMGVAGWIAGTDKVLVYDDHDIWQLDLTGREAPQNLTGSYGVQHNMRFRLAAATGIIHEISRNEPLLLIALNLTTKENGFYWITPNKSSTPIPLAMGPYTYYHPQGSVHLSIDDDAGIPPIRLGRNNSWIVKRQSDREAANYYLTHDFKIFIALTNFAPEKAYNWLEAELVTWTRPDGDTNQGVLYKPSDFDPKKKYPIIVNVYSRQSDGVYTYMRPDYSNCPVFNIPYLVSRGYLVFMPDMHYMIGAHGKSGLLSVESGVHALSNRSYVDTSKMALAGHSFSGQSAYYIAANSKLFKAIIAGAGWTDMISSYLQLSGKAGIAKTKGFMDFLEPNFNNYTIWERPDLYLAESPVLKANQVNTPLLIFHNQFDLKPFEQAVEMYLALYRLQKPVWMLQYDGAQHLVWGKQRIDFTIRMTQFFDHYLKGLSAPQWMTRGIRASQKGIDDGYILDKHYKCFPFCTVCNNP